MFAACELRISRSSSLKDSLRSLAMVSRFGPEASRQLGVFEEDGDA
jgi:hypothetical protein